MNSLRLFWIIALLCGKLAVAAGTADLVQTLQADDLTARLAALKTLESHVAQASAPSGDPALRAALERELLGHVASAEISDLSRAYLIRLLPPIASEASLKLMLQVVADAKTSRMLGNDAAGLIALLVDQVAPDTLVNGLLTASDPARELLWAALALRADARLAKPLVKQFRAKKLLLDDLAIQTLGAMGGRDAAAYLVAQWKNAEGPRRTTLARAIVHTGAATHSELQALCRQSEAAEIRVAALRQWVVKNEKAALAFTRSQLEAGAADSTALIAGQLAAGGPASWQWITQKNSALPDAVVVTVLQRIREQRRQDLEPWVLQRLQGSSEAVELAALLCLEAVGGSPSTEPLLARVQSTSRKISAAAVNTLAVLKDDALDARLKGIMADPQHPQFLAAYELSARRNREGSTGYFNELFAARRPAGKELTASLRALESIGDFDSVKLLLARLKAEAEASAVRAIQISLKRVVIRLDQPDRIWRELLAPVFSPPSSEELEGRVLPLLDAIASREALALCLQRVKGDNVMLAQAAEQALVRWRNIEVCDYWLTVLNDPTKEAAVRDRAVSAIDLTLRSDAQAGSPKEVTEKAAQLFLATESHALRDKLLGLVGGMPSRWKAVFSAKLEPHANQLAGYREQIEALTKKQSKADQ